MPGWTQMYETNYGAGIGYAAAPAAATTGGVSHTAFIIWTIVLALAAVAILGGLQVAGFSFLFRR